MMGNWLNLLVTITVAEVIVYWVSIITVAMIAGIGWALYISEKRKRFH